MTTYTAEQVAALPQELQEALKAEEMVRLEMARRAFRYFLPYCMVERTGQGMVPLEVWDYVDEMVTLLETERRLVVPKSRKIGFTTLMSNYGLWHASYTPHAYVLLISKREEEAIEFLEMCKGTYQALPRALQTPLDDSSGAGILHRANNRSHMSFANGSRIVVMPSTEDAGRGPAPTLILLDEADYHQYLEQALVSLRPAIADNPDAKIVVFSTVNAYKMATPFQQMIAEAPGNGYELRFYPWMARPGRDQAWYEEEMKGYSDLAYFQKEFPSSLAEALAPPKSIAACDLDILQEMMRDVREPTQVLTMQNGIRANIYQPFLAGKRYVAATDTSEGTGQDYSVTAILESTTGYLVADIASNVIAHHEFAVASNELLNMYDAPIWAIEDNGSGQVVLEVVKQLRYRRLYYYSEGKAGWHTFDTGGLAHPEGSRAVVWEDLIYAINNRQFTIPSKLCMEQLMTLIRNKDKRGRVEAQQGGHDDFPMALAIAWQLRRYARPAAGERGRSTDTRDRFNSELIRPRRRGWSSW